MLNPVVEGFTENWAAENNAEEVEVDVLDDFREQHLPKDVSVRWFVQLKSLCLPEAKPQRGSLLNG